MLIVLSVPFFLASHYVDLSNGAIAFDWKIFHEGVHISDIGAGYGNRVYTPPWAILFLAPLASLPLNLGWALMLYLTTLMIVVSVPRSEALHLWVLAILLLLITYPSLRNYADVNLEAYVILGVLLSIYAYHSKKPFLLAIAVLIASIKPQSVFLLMIVLGIYILQTFQKRDILKFGGLVGAVFGITMLLWGYAWLSNLQSVPSGISLKAGLSALGLASPLIVIAQIVVIIATLTIAFRGNQELSRMKVGLLMVGSMVAAPYVNALSVVSVLAIAVTAYFLKHPFLGLIIFVVYSLPYTNMMSMNALGMTIFDNPPFWMFALLLVWVLLAREVYIEEIRPLSITDEQMTNLKET